MKISAVINTYNEGANIRHCLESIFSQVDEIVISDMHSTDETISICKEFDAKIVYQEKRPFGTIIRQHGVDHATHDWIFIIDADETAPSTLLEELRRIASSGKFQIVGVPRVNYFFGINFTGRGFPQEHIDRFFRKGAVEFVDHPHQWGKLHGCRVELPFESSCSLVHYGATNVKNWITKANSYTEFEAESLREMGCKPNFRTICFRPFKVFLIHFLRYGGWKAGTSGLVFSGLWAAYWLIAAAKLWQRTKDSDLMEIRE